MTTTTIADIWQALAQRDAARSAYRASIQNHGGTFYRNGQRVTSGVAVTTKVLATTKHLGLGQIAEHLLALPQDTRLGTWYDHENDQWEISHTAVFDRKGAIALARSLGERYVYDIDADECVAVA